MTIAENNVQSEFLNYVLGSNKRLALPGRMWDPQRRSGALVLT
jgi:hypothetical protein